MLFNAHHRRLGDLLAGTLLLRDERINLDKYAVPAAAAPAHESAAAPLPAADVELILSFLERASQLEPSARERLTRSMVERFGGHLGPEAKAAALASAEASEGFLRRRAQG
jgi:hypothetical protein